MTNPHDPIWSEAGQGIRFDKPNRSQLPMVVFPCRSHHLTELYTRENQCDNLLLHHHHQHHHHLRTCFAFVWLEVIASRSKLLSQHSSVNGIKICVTTIGAPCSILRLNATSSLSELFACIRPVAKAACISICSRFQLEATFFQFFYSIKDSHDTVPHAAETLASETRP